MKIFNKMKKIFWILLITIFLILAPKADFVLAQENQAYPVREFQEIDYSTETDFSNGVNLYLFYGTTCPHCKKAEKFLETLKPKYPQLQIKSYEVFGNKENAELLLKLFEACGEKKQVRVPAIFVGKEVIIGYWNDETTGEQIESAVKECLDKACEDHLKKLGECETCDCKGESCQCKVCDCKPSETEMGQIIQLPLIGRVDISKMSLPVLTFTLAALDGLNPCAMWILLFLIALLISTNSRKRMWLIGGTFVAASGIVYYLLLSAWLNLFLAISYVNLTRILIGIFALGIGAWQIKEFVTYKGTCPITDGSAKFKDRIKNGLKNQTEKIVFSPFTFGILGGVILLALGVNLLEFFCSAGLPAIYTQILALNKLGAVNYYLYLLLYTFVFMLDDLIVLSLALITLSRVGFSERYNYWSNLIGGLLILILGTLLILKPEFLMFG